VQALLALACTMFDYVVIDIGRTISAVTLRALDACQRIYVVLQLTLPFIRDGRRLLDVFRSLDYQSSKVRWIVNRHEKGGEISLDDLKRTLNVKELTTLPNQYAVVASSVNQGIPVGRLAPNSPITKALRELADSIAPAAPAPKAGGWLGGLLRGGAE
jgi:pilus assembly protein CpaE